MDTSLMEVIADQEIPFTVILVDPSGEKVIIVVLTFRVTYSTEVAAQVLPNVRMLYTMPTDEAAFLMLARAAHAHGTEVMIDVEPDVCNQRDKLLRLLRETDIASFNRFGFMAATGEIPSIEAAQRLLAYGPIL